MSRTAVGDPGTLSFFSASWLSESCTSGRGPGLIAAEDNRNRRMEGMSIKTFKLKFHGSPMYGRL
jgi:hypothetical protein